MKKSLLLFLIPLAFVTVPARRGAAQYASTQLSVSAEALVQEQPPQITLSWLKDDSARSYTVLRMNPASGNWDKKATLGKVLTWTDQDVQLGQSYEYKIAKLDVIAGANVPGYGYLYSGIDLPAREFSGTVELIVDDTFATALSSELDRLRTDLISDGWKVLRHDVKRNDSVEYVHQLIQNDYLADSTVRSVFLFGHVPVPYSGELNPDGHPNHLGAWPADVYYADMTGQYTDITVKTGPGILAGNSNVPGDGRFDQTFVNGNVDLEIGRVDMWGMTAFSQSEKELLRNYLNKDHAFRAGTLVGEKKALISDNFGTYGEGFASDGWRNFPNFVGKDNIVQGSWFTTLDTANYLWAYGCGGGSFTSAGGIGSTTDFAKTDTKAIFTLMFGSYFGDWNVENNFLRAPLTSSSTLTCAWGGRPHWYLHHMAMGETVGYGTRLTQGNTSGIYDPGYGAGFVHVALMGDPTLRMAYAHPTSDFTYIRTQPSGPSKVIVSWNSSTMADGYNVYRAHHSYEDFLKLNTVPVAGMTYTDAAPLADSNFYIVRAIAKTVGTRGSYYVSGQASNKVLAVLSNAGVNEQSTATESISVSQDGPFVNIRVQRTDERNARLALFDLAGREVRVIDNDIYSAGQHVYTFNAVNESALSSGVYFVRLLSEKSQITQKFILSR